jgi:hypothetical protein
MRQLGKCVLRGHRRRRRGSERIGFASPSRAAGIDHFLAATLELGVGALHGIEVERLTFWPEAIDEAAPPPRPMRKPGPPSWMKSVPAPSGFFIVWRSEMLP